MARTIDAYCRKCKKSTYFDFDGGGWECRSCGSYNPQCDHGELDDLKFLFNIFRDY
jgi:hypothetical protein